MQEAIHSKVKWLILDRQASPWITRPLTGVSNQEIVFELGTDLVALKGAFRASSDCLLSFPECENVVLRGEQTDGNQPARIRMHKQDFQSATHEKSEWRHGVAFFGCRNVLVQDLTIELTGGDGIVPFLRIVSGWRRDSTSQTKRIPRRLNLWDRCDA